MFLLTSGELPLTPAGRRALLAFVAGGGGFVGVHSATDTFHHWPAYRQLIGAEFSHHPHPSLQPVIVERRDALTAGVPSRFVIGEEFYVFRHDPRPHVHVLARARHRARRTRPPARLVPARRPRPCLLRRARPFPRHLE